MINLYVLKELKITNHMQLLVCTSTELAQSKPNSGLFKPDAYAGQKSGKGFHKSGRVSRKITIVDFTPLYKYLETRGAK